jgi:arylsulfatase A-like enzyme/tetratricopeptide (TPR) repeat protein
MNRRLGVFFRLLSLVVAVTLAAAPWAEASIKPERLNVLFISVDTLRPDFLSCYGGKLVETRNIDSLAREGIAFSRALAHNPLTLPSHVNMLTGTTPLAHGVHDNLGFRLDDGALTLAEHLKANGWRTAAVVGAFPLDSRFGLSQGFDLYDDWYGEKKTGADFFFVERKGEEVVRRALGWLEGQGQSRWFLFLHLFDPHQPYLPPPAYQKRYARNPYAGEVAYVDDCLGRLLERLKEAGLADKTLIIFTSDHGEALGEHGEESHGYFAYNSTLQVPLIFRAPAFFKGGRTIAEAVSHIDIFPTLCDLLGLAKPSSLEGRSLLPLIESKKQAAAPIYFESLAPFYNRNWAPLRGVIMNGHKYIDLPLAELYDLQTDFKEEKNLHSAQASGPYQKELHGLLTRAAGRERDARRKASREEEQALRSLGYLGGSGGQKKTFQASDDLKTLLPLQAKLMEAAALHNRGSSPEAAQELEELIRAKKDFATAYEYLANVYYQTGNLAKAVDTLEKGIASCPPHSQMLGKLGIYLSEMGDQKKAIQVLEEAVALDPYDAEMWNYLGVAHWKLNDLEKAEQYYQKSLALDRNYAGALNNLGSLYLTRQNPDKAIEFFDRSLQFDPNLASAYNGKGTALAMKGRLEEAVGLWKKAVALEPGQAMAFYNLGLALVKLNRPQEALPFLEKYVELVPAGDPDRPKITRLIESIKNRLPR